MTRSTIWNIDRAQYAEPPLRLIPGAVCNACRRFFHTPISANVACFWCHAGTFTHRSEWTFAWCPTCDGEDPFCGACHGKRVAATPIE